MLLGTRTQLLASAAAGFAVCTPAYAQDAPTSAQTAVSQATNVAPTNQSVTDDNSQAIVVTAQKRAQVLLDVPASVTVVGGDTLERQQATNFQDYLSLVPGLSLNGSTAGVTRVTLARRQHRRRRLDGRDLHGRRAVRIEHRPRQRRDPLGRLRSVRLSTASKFCAARRAPSTAQARLAAFCATSPTRPS